LVGFQPAKRACIVRVSQGMTALPDREINGLAIEMPTDSLINQEGMGRNLTLSVSQMFPAGDTSF